MASLTSDTSCDTHVALPRIGTGEWRISSLLHSVSIFPEPHFGQALTQVLPKS